jgi:hypothetical protein
LQDGAKVEENFKFNDRDGKEQSFNLRETALYALDNNLESICPSMYGFFRKIFPLPGLLPGGDGCLLNFVCINVFVRLLACMLLSPNVCFC